MKIAQSNVMMTSSREYSRLQAGTGKEKGPDFLQLAQNALSNGRDEFLSGRGWEEDSNNYTADKRRQGDLKEHFFQGRPAAAGVLKADEGSDDISKEFSLQFDLFVILFKRLMYGGAFGAMGGKAAFSPSYNSAFQQRMVTFEEHESTEFHAKGQALTEDGRSIDFNLDISMSRSYMEYMDVSIPIAVNALLDPLVINVDSAITGLSDQKFSFDLDMDGQKEEISMLKRGSGFLALDENEDGIINDGSELFGAKTGDGFGELRRFDLDNNGWIDENDRVFERLKVWFKDETGRDVLMDLKEADIGAIFLGEAETEFSLKGSDAGTRGLIRSTGFFLKESFGMGTVQHVDLSAEENEALEESPDISLPGSSGGNIIMLNNPADTFKEPSQKEAVFKKKDRTENGKGVSKKTEEEFRRERIEQRRLRQKEYEEKRLEELQKRKERLEEELEETTLRRLFLDDMDEVV